MVNIYISMISMRYQKIAGPEGFGRSVQWMADFFHTYDGLLASPRPARLQAALDVMMGLFDRVGLQTNVKKRL